MDDLIQAISQPAIALAVPLIVAALKRFVERIPVWLLPILAGALGPGVDQLLALIASTPAQGTKAVLLGLAGVGVREVYDQARKAMASSG